MFFIGERNMCKKFFIFILGMLLTATTFSGTRNSIAQILPIVSIMSNLKSKQVPHTENSKDNNNLLSSGEDYVDFAGDWIGQCYEGDPGKLIEGISVPIHIEGYGEELKFCYEGNCQSLEIGKDLGEHVVIGNAFWDYHLAFKWFNKSSLAFYLTELKVEEHEYMFSNMIRVVMSKEQDKLILRTDYNYFANTDESEHMNIVCKFDPKV